MMHELPSGKPDQKPGSLFSRLAALTSSKPFRQSLVIVVGSIMCLAIFLITVTPKRYNLSVGMVPNQTIAANKDVEDELTTLRNREAAAAAVTPIYHYQDGITEKVMLNLDAVYAQMLAVRQFAQSLPDYGPNRTYTQEEYEAAHNIINLLPLKDFQLSTLMNATESQFDEMFSSLSPAIRNTMQGNVTQGQESIAITAIMQVVGFKTNVSLLQNVVLPLLRAIILPNMVVDDVATETARQAAWEAVEPVMYQQGQNIVVAGEGRIRENQVAMLNALGLLSDNSIDTAMYFGASALAIGILSLMGVALAVFCKPLFSDVKRLLIVYLVVTSTLGLGLLSKSLELIYLAPLIFPYMLLTVTLDVLPAIIAGAASTLVSVLMMVTGTASTNIDMINLLVMGLVSGSLTTIMLHKKYQRSYILFSGGVASLASFIIVLSIGLMTSMSIKQTFNKSLWAMAGTAINALLCMSVQPVTESVFNLPTPMRLLDLTNPNHPLMRRLLMEAPGTYHHSIIIANLAEASAEAIGANPLLARAGAYFHDIGKLKRPLFFKENQIGSGNIHDTTDPQISAAIIISHIREGLALAKQHRLPYEIQQIIAEHHGDSLVAYFYHKAKQAAGDKPVNEADFRYPGTPPQTAEGAVIMICDTVEAAIRTLSNPTTNEISAFIDELIQKKVQSGMMVNAPLTLSQLNLIRDTCAAAIYGVFHERIEYPGTSAKLPASDRLISHLQSIRSATRARPTRSLARTGGSQALSADNDQQDAPIDKPNEHSPSPDSPVKEDETP